jgi:hypothetical protein
MKQLKLISILLILSVLIVSCWGSDPDQEDPVRVYPREQVERTVLVYIVGDNGQKDLSSLFVDNIADMKTGMQAVDDAKFNLVVYSEMQNDVPHLLSIYQENGNVVTDTLVTYPEQNPLEKHVMAEIIAQTIDMFPADDYGLVFLSHSASWIPTEQDANTRSLGLYRNTGMNIPDFHEVLLAAFPEPLKFILFDSCNMQSIEVAYELRDCADFFIGSPTEIPGPGAPYDRVVPALFAETNPAMDIANAYFSLYAQRYTGERPVSNDNWTGGVSTSVIKSEGLDELAAITRDIILRYVQKDVTLTTVGIQRYDWSRANANHDLDGFLQSIVEGTDNADYQAWRTALDNARPYWETTAVNYSSFTGLFSMEAAEGVSMYIPRGEPTSMLNTFFQTLQWHSAAGWDEIRW